MRIVAYVCPSAPIVDYDELYKVDIQSLDFLSSHFANLFDSHTCSSFIIFYPDYFTINSIGNIFCDFHYVGPIYHDEDHRFWIKSFKYRYPMTDYILVTMLDSDKYLQDTPDSDFESS
jgi:hypothetical protein